MLNIRIGDSLEMIRDGNEVRVRKLDRKAVLSKAFGSWKDVKEDGVAYVKKMREELEQRIKRLGL